MVSDWFWVHTGSKSRAKDDEFEPLSSIDFDNVLSESGNCGGNYRGEDDRLYGNEETSD